MTMVPTSATTSRTGRAEAGNDRKCSLKLRLTKKNRSPSRAFHPNALSQLASSCSRNQVRASCPICSAVNALGCSLFAHARPG